MERKVVTLLTGDDPDRLHEALSHAGFRRSQDLAYRPACDDCNACVPVRVLVGGFAPNRTQRRIWRKNSGVTMRLVPPYATREHYALFRRYVLSRHAGGGMADMDFADYRAMIEDSPVSTHLAEYREADGRLFGVCLTDRMSDGQSLVYSFFEPAAEGRSPGCFMVLAAIATAQSQGLDYVYLGYWIGQSRKMAYKRTYQPLEALTPNGWQPLGPPDEGESPGPAPDTAEAAD